MSVSHEQRQKMETGMEKEEDLFWQLFYTILEQDVKTKKKEELKHLLDIWSYRFPEEFEQSDEYVSLLLTESPEVISILLRAGVDPELVFEEMLFALDGNKGGDESASENLLPLTAQNYPLATKADLARARRILRTLADIINVPAHVEDELRRRRALGKLRGVQYDKSISNIVKEWK